MSVSPLPNVTYPHLLGVDMYHADGPVQMHALLAAGIAFLYVKATQGNTYVDPAHDDTVARSRSVSLPVGSYHFLDPHVNPKAQAAYFLKHAPVVKGDLVHAMDSETDGPNIGEISYEFAEEMKRLTGRWPANYSGDSFFTDHLRAKFNPPENYLNWIARYGPHEPVNPYTIWQYSDAGQIAGVAHALDLNCFRGSVADLMTHTYK